MHVTMAEPRHCDRLNSKIEHIGVSDSHDEYSTIPDDEYSIDSDDEVADLISMSSDEYIDYDFDTSSSSRHLRSER